MGREPKADDRRKASEDDEAERKKKKKHRGSDSESGRSESRGRSKRKKKDKEKRKHKKKRSRSRSVERRKKRSRTRSKEKRRSRSGSAFRFDSPPKEYALNSARNNPLPSAEALYEMFGPDINPAELGKRMLMLSQGQHAQTTKVDRKLYVGNLPANMTAEVLSELLNQALKQMGVGANQPGNPITSTWVSQDGHYAFLEFRTSEEAERGFALNNVELLGQRLKVGRPKTYNLAKTYTAPVTAVLPSAMLAGIPGAMYLQCSTTESFKLCLMVKYNPPSPVLAFTNLATEEELEADEEYQEILEDVRSECEKLVRVVSMKAPRPSKHYEEPGAGSIFVQFSSTDDAKLVRRELVGKLFSGRTVEAGFYPEDKYIKDDLGDPEFTIVK